MSETTKQTCRKCGGELKRLIAYGDGPEYFMCADCGHMEKPDGRKSNGSKTVQDPLQTAILDDCDAVQPRTPRLNDWIENEMVNPPSAKIKYAYHRQKIEKMESKPTEKKPDGRRNNGAKKGVARPTMLRYPEQGRMVKVAITLTPEHHRLTAGQRSKMIHDGLNLLLNLPAQSASNSEPDGE